MGIFEVLMIVVVAVIFGILFSYIFNYAGPWGKLWTFILILVLAGLAAAGWIEPVGPVYLDIAWLPVLFVIFIFALFLAAATPPAHREKNKTATEKPAEDREYVPQIALSIFFWSFLVLMLFIVVWGILR